MIIIFKDKLILANFLSNLFYSLAYPSIHYYLIKDAGQKMISLNSIILCIAGIIVPLLWNKYSDTLYLKYGYLLSIECILYSIIAFLVIFSFITPKAYYILDTFLFAIVTKNIISGNIKLKSLLYKDGQREKFDNNSNIASNASSLIGFTISLLIEFPISVGFILITIGICLDNIFYYNVYKKTIKKENILCSETAK